MLDIIKNINDAVNGFVWGIPAMICIIGVGILLSCRTKFIQFRRFPYAIKASIELTRNTMLFMRFQRMSQLHLRTAKM